MADKQLIKQIYNKIPKRFYECLSLCTSNHLRNCNCRNTEIKDTEDKLLKQYLSDLPQEYQDEPDTIAQQKHLAHNNAIRLVSNMCVDNNLRCTKELDMYNDFVTDFKEAYDTKDARVILVLSSLFRMFIKLKTYYNESNSSDVLIKSIGKLGETTSINPIEPLILQYEKERINCLEKLDKMINGQINKNYNIDFKSEMEKTFTDRMKRMKKAAEVVVEAEEVKPKPKVKVKKGKEMSKNSDKSTMHVLQQ